MKRIILVAILAPVTLLAGSRNSSRYSIPAEASDGGGGASSSAAYSNVGNVGGFAGVSTAVTKTAKHGYVGQLYEVTTLTLAANPPSVDEGGATQLSAVATMDDGTWVQPTPA